MNWVQLQTLLWLRWRLTWNQWRRGGQVNAVIMFLLLLGGAALALVGAFGGFAVGMFALSGASPQVVALVWDGLVVLYLFLLGMELVSQLQRSEIIDMSRLMHLPVSLRDVFLLNYIVSHFSLSLAVMLPAALGLAAGMAVRCGPGQCLLFPLALGFFFMISAWTYCLRGWLAALMVNKRRRRAILVTITMAFVLLMQLPNLVMNVYTAHYAHRPGAAPGPFARERWVAALDVAHRCVPLLWLPAGARALAEGRPWISVCCAAGMIALGAWGLARAYRATLRWYQGGETKKPARIRAARALPAAGGRLLVEWNLPAVPEQAAAVALAAFRSLSRAPEVKMGLATNVLIFAVMGAGFLLRGGGAASESVRPFLASAAVALAFMGLAHFIFNLFGFDRAGFRSLVLSPAPRRLVLLGKNLALLPVAAAVLAIYLALVAALARLTALDVLSSILEFAGAFLLLSAVGNYVSIVAPYRVPAGSMRPARAKGWAQLILILTHGLLPLALLPVFIPPLIGLLVTRLGRPFGAEAAAFCALWMAALCAVLYIWSLGPLGSLLQRREQRILEVVTQEVE